MILVLGFICLLVMRGSTPAMGKRILQPRPASYSVPTPAIDKIPATAQLPKLIVFDLDHTLWTPELYTLARGRDTTSWKPKGNEDVWLLDGAYAALHELSTHPRWQDTAIGIASKTNEASWAHNLLNEIKIGDKSIVSLCSPGLIQIYRGNKQRHFNAIKSACDGGVEFGDMLFFDDARDGKYGNCVPVSELGVHAAYCPRGLTVDVWENALLSYTSLRPKGPHVMGKVVDPPKAQQQMASKKKAQVTSQSSKTEQQDAEDLTAEPLEDTEHMKCFSMNMPFAGLLAHGVKTLESRNGTMFTSMAKKGERVLLHVGQRQYPDGGEHRVILRERGLSEKEINRVTNLPKGFRKGQAIAVVEIGETFVPENEAARSTAEIEQGVVARGAVMGRRITKVASVQWLKQGFPLKGQPGFFQCDIPKDFLPNSREASADSIDTRKVGGECKPVERASSSTGNGEQEVTAGKKIDPGYTWEGGGGVDVCASRLNDDPFDEKSSKVDEWELFKERVAEKMEDDPNANAGRWP